MKLSLCLALALVILFGMSGVQAALVPTGLKSEAVPNSLGLLLNEYSFSWKVEGQVGYRILVARERPVLDANVGDLWDSGWRSGDWQDGVVGQGKAFADGATVWWKVRVRDESGEAGGWSEAAKIEVPKAGAKVKPVKRPTGLKGGELEFIEGKFEKAIRLGAKRPVIWSEDYEGLRPTGATTIAAWIKPEQALDRWQCLFRKEDGNDRRLLAIGKEGPFWGVWCGFGIGGTYVEFGAPYDARRLLDDKWHHVAVSFDGEHLRLFVDGVVIGEKAQKGVLGNGGAARAFIGSYGGGAEHFEGGIDELAVYAHGFGEEGIAALFSGDIEELLPVPVAHWMFDGTIDNEVSYVPEAAKSRVVLLGGTLISRMDRYGFLEGAITSHWPHHDLTFRNLGWPADDVRGTARSEFGSAHNTQSWQPPKGQGGYGFEKLKKQLDEANPSTLIVGYGGEAAFADTKEKMTAFEEDYRALIAELERTGAELILLTPVPQFRHGGVLADPAERNKRLEHASKFILALAKERGHGMVNLYDPVMLGAQDPKAMTSPYYENGVHLNEAGYRRLAYLITLRLDILSGYERELNFQDSAGVKFETADYGRRENEEKTRRGIRFDFLRDELPPLTRTHSGPSTGELAARVWIDGVEAVQGGDGLMRSGADIDQAEKLRQVIIEKNQLHRYRLNPINKAYIFLFRRHEMGHLAYELEDFDDLIAGKEKAISKLRVPRIHSYEFEYRKEWTPPRDYPDHEVPKNIPAPDVEAELKAFKVAEGFEVNLFASDPMIFNPINLNWDKRGRAWVATSSTYPHIVPGRIPNDRIVILEDTDLDGVADKHTVFAEGLTVPHSVMPVEGGAYVCSTTELLFLADHDGDGVADGKRVVYSGFGNADVHHMIHGLRWSPWGDLFFTQSIYINSFVETPHGPRRLNGSGIWRFRPESERLEVFSRGMVNPWGFAFDRWGRSFGTDGAGGSGPHDVFPGSAFGTAVGAPRVLGGLIPGKPKNTAAEVMSGRHLPAHWQGSLLANDFRANRTVRYELEESGSGFKSKEVETVLHSSHRSFRPVDIKMGPDGAVYVVDWYNPIIDHGEVDFHHPLRDKSHGRIWRLTATGRPLVDPPKIAEATLGELFDDLKSPEQYTRVQANRELASRPCQGLLGPLKDWVAALDRSDPDFEHHRVEALWLLMAHRAAPAKLVEELLVSSNPQVRAAAVRAVGNWNSRTGSIAQLDLLGRAVEDEHPRVRLEAVSALRGIGTLDAANRALRALDYEVDANLDFALEMAVRDMRNQWLPAMREGKRLFDGKPEHLAYALQKVNDPRAIAGLVPLIAKGELKGEARANAVAIVSALGDGGSIDVMLTLIDRSPKLLLSIAEGAVRNKAKPSQGDRVGRYLEAADEGVRIAAAKLAGAWKVASARDRLVERIEKADRVAERLAMASALTKLGSGPALQALRASGNPPRVRAAVVTAQVAAGSVEATRIAAEILQDLEEAADARIVFEAFLAREEGPALLAKALEGSKLQEAVALAGVRLASASGREVAELIEALNEVGGLKPGSQALTPPERQVLIASLKSEGSAERGKTIYERAALVCTTCHLIEGKGGRLGPDLSTVGSYMTPESILESILNPSTAIKQGYETVIVTRKDQSVVSGLLQRKTDTAVLVRDPAGQVVSIPSGDIAKVDTSPVSLMPPGLTASLRRGELVDLMTYLTSLGR